MTDFTKVKANLERKGYKVQEFQTGKEAADYLTSEIQGKTVGFGGSMTLDSLDLMEKLEDKNTLYNHWYRPEGMSAKDVLKKAMSTDIYLSSVNGLAESGELVSIDGNGNRVASQAFGHQKVYFVIGQNKLTKDLDSAITRAKEVAGNKNAKRFGLDSPDAISKACLILTARPNGQQYEILLVHEDLGY